METLPSGIKKYEANDNATVENFNANADLLDTKLTEIDEHVSAADGHGATSAATADRIALRDANGRFKVGEPSAADDVARKDTVDNAVMGMAKTNIDNHFKASQSVQGTLTSEMNFAVRAGLPLHVLWNTTDNVAIRGTVDGGFYSLQNVPTSNILGGFYNDLLKIPVDGSEVYTGTGHKVWHNGNIPASFSLTGYQRFANGIIMQWGQANIPSGSIESVAFPIAFPSTCAAVSPTIDTPAPFAISTSGLTNAYFNVVQSSGFSRVITWIAIGY